MNNNAMFSSQKDDWETPAEIFDAFDALFHFTLDPCCTHENAKCKKHYTKEDDGLAQSWRNEVVFCNPPYGRELPKWVKKCHDEATCATVVMLIPSRTDTAWFHDYILRDGKILFLRGRIKFVGATNSAPFPSMIVVFGDEKRQKTGKRCAGECHD